MKDYTIIKIFDSYYAKTVTMDKDSLRLKFSKIYPERHRDYVLSY